MNKVDLLTIFVLREGRRGERRKNKVKILLNMPA